MPPARFDDLYGKKAKSILSDDYCFDRKFKLTTKSKSGHTLSGEGEIKPKGVDANLSLKWNVNDQVAVDKLQIKSTGRLIAETTLKGLVSDLNVTVKVQDGGGEEPSGIVDFKYTKSKFTDDVSLDVTKGPAVTVSSTVEVAPNWILGGSVKLNSGFDDKKSPSIDDAVLLVLFAGDNFSAGGAINKSKQVTLSATTKTADGVDIASTCTAEFKEGKLVKPLLTIGGLYALDADSKLQSKVDSNGIVSANYILNIRPGVKGIVSGQVDAKNFAGDSHKLGLSLILG
jgi:hypothetical protein